MRTVILLLTLALCTGLVFAQDGSEGSLLDSGKLGVYVETTGLSVDAIGVRYLVKDNLAVGSDLSFGWNNAPGGVWTSETAFALTPFLQFYFFSVGTVSLYAGPFLGFGLDTLRDSATDDRNTTMQLQAGGMAGLEWFFLQNVSLGARLQAYYLLDRNAQYDGATGTKTITSGSAVALSPYAEFLLTFYLR